MARPKGTDHDVTVATPSDDTGQGRPDRSLAEQLVDETPADLKVAGRSATLRSSPSRPFATNAHARPSPNARNTLAGNALKVSVKGTPYHAHPGYFCSSCF